MRNQLEQSGRRKFYFSALVLLAAVVICVSICSTCSPLYAYNLVATATYPGWTQEYYLYQKVEN